MDPTAKARARLDDIYEGLSPANELAEVTAKALLDAAQSAARNRPTPQAPMVSAGFSVDGAIIRGPSGTLGELTMGSEFGSTIYTQFGGRQSRGAWLFQTFREPPRSVEVEAEAWLQDLING